MAQVVECDVTDVSLFRSGSDPGAYIGLLIETNAGQTVLLRMNAEVLLLLEATLDRLREEQAALSGGQQ